MSNAIHNEQIKLTATFFQNVGIGLIVSGVYVPWILQQPAIPGISSHVFGTFVVAVGIALHLFARNLLKKIRE